MRALMNLHPTKLAKGNLRVPRMPKLKDVLLVEGLKANLININ